MHHCPTRPACLPSSLLLLILIVVLNPKGPFTPSASTSVDDSAVHAVSRNDELASSKPGVYEARMQYSRRQIVFGLV